MLSPEKSVLFAALLHKMLGLGNPLALQYRMKLVFSTTLTVWFAKDCAMDGLVKTEKKQTFVKSVTTTFSQLHSELLYYGVITSSAVYNNDENTLCSCS